MGAHIMDECGEFMPRGEDDTLEALMCAACDCHRNFHRKEGDREPTLMQQPRSTPVLTIAAAAVRSPSTTRLL
ncbi:zinc-finger homeodomain protein 5 [Phtheirospermum japonicum]|uniref:Zinc-finger homeodomain protein 5 n=1 Tax=Phtheirospermum japonicum TaxID=374723 RepID=A0A830BAU5_9LAMI|nr:zinc-finger homeodomain protein 5 [Phtheirospermum japonicum]